jgi:hypothetical protein
MESEHIVTLNCPWKIKSETVLEKLSMKMVLH